MWVRCGLALLLCVFTQWASAQPLVMVVESYHPENGWDRDYLAGLRSKLDGSAELDFFALDTKRLPTSQHLEQADLAFREIQQKKPNLVILGDDAALALLGPRLARMAMPVVFLGVNAEPQRYFSGKLPPVVTGVLERALYQQNFALIRQLLGKNSRILVLLDQDRSASILRDDIERLKVAGIDVYMASNYADWQNKVSHADKNYDALLLGTYQALSGAQAEHIDADSVMQWTAGNSPVPVFGFWDVAIGRQAAAGGMVLSGFEHGVVAGKMARSLLQMPNQQMPVQHSSPGHLIFSRAQVARWHLKIPDSLRKQISWQP